MGCGSLKAGQALYQGALPKTGYMKTGGQFYKPMAPAPTTPNYGFNYNQYANKPIINPAFNSAANSFANQQMIQSQAMMSQAKIAAMRQYSTQPKGQFQTSNTWWERIKNWWWGTNKNVQPTTVTANSIPLLLTPRSFSELKLQDKLVVAVEMNNLKDAEELIKQGIKPYVLSYDKRLGKEYSPLSKAIAGHNYDMVNVLLMAEFPKGIDIPIDEFKQIPLQISLYYSEGNEPYLTFERAHKDNINSLKIAKLLLDKSANPNQIFRNGNTPLIEAMGQRNIEAAKLLIQYGANVNQVTKRGTALRIVLERSMLPGFDSDRLEKARLLISSGADVNLLDNNGNSAMVYRLEDRDTAGVKFLLQNGVSANGVIDKSGNTPLSCLLKNYDPRNDNVLKLLVEYGANLNEPMGGSAGYYGKGTKDYTPLTYAIKQLHYAPLVKDLVENGASITQPDRHGVTPLQAAEKLNDKTMMTLLTIGAQR